MKDLFQGRKVLVCAGTGGVGKTTLAATLGIIAARAGRKTLVLTIDPAQRLAQALGLDKKIGVDVAVPSVPGLWASLIDPSREFDEFVLGSIDKGLARELFNNRLYQQLSNNLSGSQEFTSLVRLLNSVRSGQYDLVILDTPPTQNAVDFLKAPERLHALFQETVISWFADPSAGEGWIKRAIHRGTRLVTQALEAVTGSSFIAELKDFFSHISHLRGRVSEVTAEVGKLLHAKDTGFLLITGFDETKLKEALEFQIDMREEKLNLQAVIVNRWFPEWAGGEGRWPADWEKNPDFKKLRELHEKFSEFFGERQEAYERFEKRLGKAVTVIKLPDFQNTVQGLQDLEQVAQTLNEKWRTQS